MKRNFLIFAFSFFAITCYSQSKGIVGSWISLDSINKTQFLIKADGTIEKRTATANEDVWSKTPRKGTYTFKNGRNLVIKWSNKRTENVTVTFKDNNAEFYFMDPKDIRDKRGIFLRIVDEEVIIEK